MKYLKRIDEGFFKFGLNKFKISNICREYGITNYTINEDGYIDVDGNVYLHDKILTKLPLKFRNVSGDFYCHSNKLTTLEGCPTHVGSYFDCSNNQLTTLKGCPTHVGGYFNCSNNQLTTLEGCPTHVGGNFYCYSNKLTTLEGCPTHVSGDFNCSYNPVYNIWILFEDYSKIELFNDYDIIRGDVVILDRLNEFLKEIGKRPVKNVKGYKCI